MRSVVTLLLLLFAGAAGMSLFLALLGAYNWLGRSLGVEECLWSAILFCILEAICLLAGQKFWAAGAAAAACLVLAWLGYITRHERLHDALSHLAIFVMLAGTIIDIFNKRLKKHLKNIKGAVLTAVSAASFKRQIKNAFSQ
jgi:hypothetical protein